MTPEKTKEAFKIVEQILKERAPFYIANYVHPQYIQSKRFDESLMKSRITAIPDASKFEHLVFMTEEGQKLVDAGRIEKAMRWLGFLQGALWGLGITSIEEQKNINKPGEESYDAKRV